MSITVTRTKVIVPRRRTDLLSRGRLIEMLDDLLDYKLLLIAAPAGYGKTSLLVDWVHQGDLPVCWYALDFVDQDAHRFIHYFIAAISQVFPSFGKQSQAVLQNTNQGELDIDKIVTAIVNDAYDHIKEHFVFVLDDFHTVDSNDEINNFVNQIIEEMDENCHLIIASRTLASLPNLPLMVGRSMVKGLSFDELAFQPSEIQALLKQNYQRAISDETAAELEQETEGWITGLLLSAETIWNGMPDRARVARASGVGLYDYLAQQVLDQQPESVQEFLLKTSLLEEFDAGLCEAVFSNALDGTTWAGLIAEVLQNNLFVLPVENQSTWLRYHHLFRDFLQAKITKNTPDEAENILRRLAEVYTERSMWEKAYEIYQRIGDITGVIHLIESAGTPMLKSGSVGALDKWLSALPIDILNSNPALLSLQGIVKFILGNVDQGITKLNQAEAILREVKHSQALALTLVRRAASQRLLGNYQQSFNDVDDALSISGDNDAIIKAKAFRVKGLCLFNTGQLANAIKYLEKALALHEFLRDSSNQALLQLDLGLAHMSLGHFSQALTYYEQALEYWRLSENLVRQSNLLNNLGVLHYLNGKYALAGEILLEALSLSRKSGNTRIEAYSLTSLGDIYADLDALDTAQEFYRQAKEISAHIDNRFLGLYINLAEAVISRKQGNFSQAKYFLTTAKQFIRENTSDFEIGLFQLTSGQLSLAQEKTREALPALKEALGHFIAGGQNREIIRSHFSLAHAHFIQGDKQTSFLHLNQVINLGHKPNFSHSLIVASREVKDLLHYAQTTTRLVHSITQIQERMAQFENSVPIFLRNLRQNDFTGSIKQHAKLNITTLGVTEVAISGKPVTVPEWSNQKTARELFFLLLAHAKGFSKESIGLHFWPDSTPRQLKTQFKNTLYRLRRALGKEVIVFDEQEYLYRFNRALDYEYDAETFQFLMRQGENASNIKEQMTAYRTAIKLYRGDYLLDMDASWTTLEREQYAKAYFRAELALAKFTLKNGDHAATLTHCNRILQKDSCLEEAHRLAMQTYAAIGNQASLVRQFEICKNALTHELGVSPSSCTLQLYKQLVTQT